jgi:inorganic pyrophosphatase
MLAMTLGATVYSLPSMLSVFIGTALAFSAVTNVKTTAQQLMLAFMLSWLVIAFYVPFLPVAYFEGNAEHQWDLWIPEVLVAAFALLAIAKLERMRTIKRALAASHSASKSLLEPPEVDVVIEVPRGSFLKRGTTGRIDFVSPLPCPFNYGSVPVYLGLEGDLLDAVVLGPRLAFGTSVRVKAWGAITLRDRGMVDDKLICDQHPLSHSKRRNILRFFRFYAACKGLLNVWRRRPGSTRCEGWCQATQALSRAKPRDALWRGPSVEF